MARVHRGDSLNFDEYLLYGAKEFQPNRESSNENFHVEFISDSPKEQTHLYNPKIPVVRRGNPFTIVTTAIQGHNIEIDDILISFETKTQYETNIYDLSKTKKFSLLEISKTNREKPSIEIKISTSVDCSVGFYHAIVIHKGERIGQPILFYIIFNPLNSEDSVYMNKKSMFEEHVINTYTKVYCGSEYSHFGKPYDLDQFTLVCTIVCGNFLRKLSLDVRSDPLKTCRAFSALVNGNDDRGLIYGNWGEITEGTSPTAWTNAAEIYESYLKTGQPVKWGQCFVFSMLLTSMCRNIGIPCRCCSGFNVGHDNNQDGFITMKFDNESLEHLYDSETLWNFHAWNNVFIRRNDYSYNLDIDKRYKSEWQHLDGTPQERSEGIFQCGPYPIELIRNHIIDGSIQWDVAPIYYSINYTQKYLYMSNGNVVRENEIKKSCPLIVSVDEKLRKLDLTDEYKTEIVSEDVKDKVIDLDINVPKEVNINEDINFDVHVKNAPTDSTTLLVVTLDVVNVYGKRLISDYVYSSKLVFEGPSYSHTDKVSIRNDLPFDYSVAILEWNFKCFNKSIEKVKNIVKSTLILPCFGVTFRNSKYILSRGKNTISLRIENKLKIRVENISVSLHLKEKEENWNKVIPVIGPEETIDLDIEIDVEVNNFFKLSDSTLS